MNLTCDPGRGGCGKSIEMTKQVMMAFWEAYQQKRELDCTTDGCERKVSHRQIKGLIEALQKSQKSGTPRPASLHIKMKDVPSGGRAYGSRP